MLSYGWKWQNLLLFEKAWVRRKKQAIKWGFLQKSFMSKVSQIVFRKKKKNIATSIIQTQRTFRDGNMKWTAVHNSVQSAEMFIEVATTSRWYSTKSIISNCLDTLAGVLMHATELNHQLKFKSLGDDFSLSFLMLAAILFLRNLLLSKEIPPPVAFNMTNIDQGLSKWFIVHIRTDAWVSY